MIVLGTLGATLIALTLGGLSLHVPGSDSVGSMFRTYLFVLLLAVAGAVYLMAVRQVLRRPPSGRALLLVAAVAFVLRAPLVPVAPFLSSDMYRYVWDGRVIDAGINPYRYIPAAPALESLRDEAIYPHVNRRTYARTIYPPAAQIVFAAVAAISPTVVAMKLAMLAFEAMGMVCILLLLRRAGLPAARLLIYAWNPLAAWCFAGNGHVDAIAIGFVGLALIAAASERTSWSGVALALATLTKFIPVSIGPALWRPWDWKLPLCFLAACVLLYLPYSGAGAHVLGFLPHYGTEEKIVGGQGIWLVAGLATLGTPPAWVSLAYFGVVVLVLAALAGLLAARQTGGQVGQICGHAAILAACTVAAISPHYPWYFVWLAVPACIAPYRAVIWLSVVPLILYLDPWNEYFFWPSLLYVPAILLTLYDVFGRTRFVPLAAQGTR